MVLPSQGWPHNTASWWSVEAPGLGCCQARETLPPALPLIQPVISVLQDEMKLIILDHYSQASEWAAKYIRNRIIQFNPGPDKYFTLGLPTGMLWERGWCAEGRTEVAGAL